MVPFTALARDERLNAVLSWLLVGVLVVAILASLYTGATLWAGLTLVVAGAAVAPAAVTREWTVMVPWPLLALAAVAALVRATGRYPELAGYLAVATLALVGVAELDAFTSVEMSRRFAVGFAALTTLALQACWTVAQYGSDLWLGTMFLRSQRELQWDMVLVSVVSIVVAAGFQWYVGRTEHVGSPARPVGSTDDAG